MVETGKVVELKGGSAVVRVERSDACAGCGKCMMGKKSGHIDHVLDNPVGAAEGDTVVIELGKSQSVLLLALVYVFPLLLMTAAFLIAIAAGAPQYAQGLAALGTLVIAYLIIFALDKTVLKKSKYKPALIKTLGQDSPTENAGAAREGEED